MLENKQSKGIRITGRENDVLRFISNGLTNREIADHLMLSIRTVEAHRARLMIKLNIHDTAGLVKYAIKQEITNIDEHRSVQSQTP